jgi:hypothetical protein
MTSWTSDYITLKTRERFPHHAGKYQTVYTGVDAELFISDNHQETPVSESEQRLPFVGRVPPALATRTCTTIRPTTVAW